MTFIFLFIASLIFLCIFFIARLKGEKKLYILAVFFFILISFFFILYPFSNSSFLDPFKTWSGASPVDTTGRQEKFTDTEVIRIKEKVLIDAPVIKQLPELPRGCEVTALAMLLQHAQVDIDKITLAEQIKRDPTPYQIIDGNIYFGNPNDGFVGNMYTFSKPGLGVYHGPIADLAKRYLSKRILDLTESSFEELKIHLSDKRPVWVIINASYKKLPKSQFQTWHTPSGTIRITLKEHSVLLTGYDENYIYFNDPLTGEKNRKKTINDFREAWEQMGSQAITYLSK